MWTRAGVLRHVSYSTPLVIPYQSAGARKRTPRPKHNRACTPSALAAAGLLLSTLGSRVGNTSLTFHISSCAASQEVASSKTCQCYYLTRYSFVMGTALSCVCMRACELCSSVLHLPVHVQSGSAATRVRQRSKRDVQGVRLSSHDADVLVYDISLST